MKKDFFNFLKKKRKKYAKFILCYSLASVIALSQSFPSFASSVDESKLPEEDTVSSVSDLTKKVDSSSESTTVLKTKETISSEDNTSKLRITTDNDSKENEDSSKDDNDSKKNEESSKDDNDSKENKESSKDDNDSKENKESSKDDNDSKKNEESSKDDNDSKENKESSKDDNDSKENEDSSTTDKNSKENEKSSKDDNDSKENEESSTTDKNSKNTEDSTKNDENSKENENIKDTNTNLKENEEISKDDKSSKDAQETSNTTENSEKNTDSPESDSVSDSTAKENSTETEVYETIEDIEIATEDPSEYDDNELLVQFKTDISEKRVKEIAETLPKTTLKSYSDGIAVFTANSKTTIEKNISILSTIEEISIIQPNYKYSFSSAGEEEEIDELTDTISSSSFPNDTFFSKQWGLYNKNSSQSNRTPSSSSSSNRIDINILDAWKNFQSNNEVIVAVIDTGVDYKHKDLKDHMWYNKAELDGTKGIDDDNNGYTDDIYGWDFYNDDATVCHYSGTAASKKDNDNHGTRCAGIITATANNNFGIAGVASNVNVKIMSLKTAGGPNAEGDTANIIKAIKYASYNGAKICNASWNCDTDDPALKLAINESNMLFICSAGNGYGTDIDYEPSYPCSYNLTNIVGVTSIDPDGTLSYFSNYGKNSVSMAAPGSNICSTIVGKYGYDSGTSMATPFVTGVAAMLYAYDPTLYPARAKSLLLSSIKTLSTLENKVVTSGIIDASLAVSKIQKKTYKVDKTPPTITPTVIPRKTGAYLSVSVKDTGGSCTRIRRYAYGKLSASYFKNGEKGKSLAPGGKPFVTTQGYYTIYAQDNAGNEAVKIIKVSFDKTPPSLSLSYKKSGKKYKVTIKASDSASGLSEVRYAKSKHTASYMKSKGKKLGTFTSKTKTITVSSKGTYSFYAKDKAGNTVVKTLTIK